MTDDQPTTRPGDAELTWPVGTVLRCPDGFILVQTYPGRWQTPGALGWVESIDHLYKPVELVPAAKPDLSEGWTAVRTDQWLSTLAAGDRAKYAGQLLHRAVYLREYGEDESGLTWDRWLREVEVFLRQPGGDDART